jgi:hypothetical protein
MNQLELKFFHFFNNKCQELCNVDISEHYENLAGISSISVESLLKIDEILINEWIYVLKEKQQVNQEVDIIKKTTMFLNHVRSLINDYNDSKAYYQNTTLVEIELHNNDLGFNLVEKSEVEAMTHSLFDEKLAISDAIAILKNKKTASLICQNFNTLNLKNKLLTL